MRDQLREKWEGAGREAGGNRRGGVGENRTFKHVFVLLCSPSLPRPLSSSCIPPSSKGIVFSTPFFPSLSVYFFFLRICSFPCIPHARPFTLYLFSVQFLPQTSSSSPHSKSIHSLILCLSLWSLPLVCVLRCTTFPSVLFMGRLHSASPMSSTPCHSFFLTSIVPFPLSSLSFAFSILGFSLLHL